jgi:hypothetical protein
MEPLGEVQRDRSLLLGRKLARALTGVAIVILATVASGGPLRLASRPADVMLIYVGAQDCAPCRAWRTGDGAAFLASTESAGITYREVKSPHLEDILADENWPEDIRDYRNSIRRSDGVPLWLVVAERRIVEQHFGTTAWQRRILPALKSYSR